MMPDNVLSSQLEYAQFEYPDNIPTGPLFDYQLGGIALSDPTQGLQYQVWSVVYTVVDGSVLLTADNHPTPILLFTRLGIEHISLTFDQNMHPCIAFQIGNQSTFWFFDTISGTQIFFNLPFGAYSPCCSLDDKRALEITAGISDVILAYIYLDTLYFRMQQDRYLVQYPLQADLSTLVFAPSLGKIGMNILNRFQFRVDGALYV